jgi:uncharacterized protein (DUF779 family)
MKTGSGKPIPKEEAMKLCSEIRNEKGVKLFSQCWGCLKFSKGDPAKMCYSSKPDNRGCGLVNKQYDSLFGS